MAYDDPTVLDGTNPTLDASDLSYEFEKAQVHRNVTHVLRHSKIL